MNRLYFGDNLEIMREMESEHIDLICTDPPFNSGRDYNAFFQESKAQEKAFTDIWQWDTDAIESREDIRERADANDTYKALNTCLEGYDLVLHNAVKGNKGAMRAYLAFMGPRLAEMHRLLRNTGSIYLHCDPAASHYLKCIMDAIWDQDNLKDNEYFRNEIIWFHQGTWIQPTTKYPRRHDTLLFYTKTSDYIFNLLYEDNAEQQVNYQRWRKYLDGDIIYGRNMPTQDTRFTTYLNRFVKEHGRQPNDNDPVLKITGSRMGTVQYVKVVDPKSSEALSYDTQKPIALYKRMIEASSDKGMLVMDPFCGCGTTIDAAHTLKRNWIGIDLTIIALDPISKRMRDRHANSDNEPLQPHKDYEIVGYPINMQEVYELVRNEKKQHDFANWAVTRLGMIPTPDVRDGGKDGIGTVMLWDPEAEYKTDKRIISEVKTGNFTINDVRAFCHTITQQKAIAGIFITLERITDGMKQIAADIGDFTLPNNNTPYPKLQFWQITDEYFENPSFLRDNIRLPYNWIISRKKSGRHFGNQQLELL